MNTQPRDSRNPKPSSKDGFTLIEVMVSMVILVFGVLALGGTTMYVMRQVNVSDLWTERVAAVQSVVERVKAQPYDTVANGVDTLGAFAVEWRSWTEGARSKGVEVVSTGPGLVSTANGPMIDPAVVDTLYYQVVRP
jgi:prepilin-type N-terminal cleavage/methylation domain-containing protein